LTKGVGLMDAYVSTPYGWRDHYHWHTYLTGMLSLKK